MIETFNQPDEMIKNKQNGLFMADLKQFNFNRIYVRIWQSSLPQQRSGSGFAKRFFLSEFLVSLLQFLIER